MVIRHGHRLSQLELHGRVDAWIDNFFACTYVVLLSGQVEVVFPVKFQSELGHFCCGQPLKLDILRNASVFVHP
jgi:hypothetical protein